MSEDNRRDSTNTRSAQSGRTITFTLCSASIRLDVRAVEMTQDEVLETLKDCLCISAPHTLRERILSHVRNGVIERDNCGRD